MKDAESADEQFRQRVGFAGMLGVAFTGGIYLMTLLRPVLEPFLWAMFLVVVLQPIASVFEASLLCCGRFVCGGRMRRRQGCFHRKDHREDAVELAPIAAQRDEEDAEQLWRVSSDLSAAAEMEDACGDCCACVSRLAAVAFALAVVMGVAVAVSMLVFDAALHLKENLAIYEKGARNTVKELKDISSHFLGRMPQKVADELSEKTLASVQAIASGMLTDFLEHFGKLLVEVLMFGLYVMFWLCTPMPMNTQTEIIFRRYLFLKGSACLCYGICVGVMLRILAVDIAIFFGLISFLFSFIPEVGAFIAMTLPVPVILFDSRLPQPFLTVFTATLGQLALKFIFSNIVEVKLIEHDATMKMHPVVTLLAVAFFGFIWGPTGMLLCVPLMTSVKVAVDSDMVPPSYRDPILVLLEGDRLAPMRLQRRKRAVSS
eukprot:TRINITY_DN58530_c0_g1_i1.p1 TRINITY_DN58530_c0_g1~~TRINITY_DN58530_c0_g1_i1.p1  ORF type:complete len:431 (+),score=121.25 TRINITY_DN58530_c0_g1_i1:168-1460(+)